MAWNLNFLAPQIAERNHLFQNDNGIVLQNKLTLPDWSTCQRPFTSVILPTYNRKDLLKGALESLIAQDYPGDLFEIIVVDNAISNDTAQLVIRITHESTRKINIKYIQEDRTGLVYSRHTGASHAKGDILLFGDDDAVYEKTWISTLALFYLQHPEVGAVGTKMVIKWDDTPEPWVIQYENVLGKLDYGHQPIVRKNLLINGGSFSILKQVLYDLHGFNPGQKLDSIVGDSETGLCRKLANAGIPVGWTPMTTMWHVQQVKKHGTIRDLSRRFRNNGICDAYYVTFYDLNPLEILIDILRKTRHFILRILGAYFFRKKERIRYDVPLEAAYYVNYLRHLWLYRFNRKIRSEVLNRDWEFNKNYKAPPISFCKGEAYDEEVGNEYN